MNYFEIINKVLLELNYRPIEDFGRIFKSEHQKILDVINRVNKDVLATYDWPFLERTAQIKVLAGENTCILPFDGNIKAVFLGNNKFQFIQDAYKIKNGDICGDYYSIEPADGGQKARLIVSKRNKDTDLCVIYYSTNYVMGENGTFKADFSGKNDISSIPMPYAEQILVYGTCLKVKANPAYPKFGFWNTMYIQALANLRQKSPQTKECEPFISIA